MSGLGWSSAIKTGDVRQPRAMDNEAAFLHDFLSYLVNSERRPGNTILYPPQYYCSAWHKLVSFTQIRSLNAPPAASSSPQFDPAPREQTIDQNSPSRRFTNFETIYMQYELGEGSGSTELPILGERSQLEAIGRVILVLFLSVIPSYSINSSLLLRCRNMLRKEERPVRLSHSIFSATPLPFSTLRSTSAHAAVTQVCSVYNTA